CYFISYFVNFSYHFISNLKPSSTFLDMETRVIILSGSLAFVIALLTVSYRSIETAVMSPADSLRHE
ncbi:MAG: hypothetical protein MUP98_08775, partial [Candidatus Aminicenantes bacterium]|nr:hypothetical protein [Candidatus Aminicenantes bacterium]